MKNVPNQYTLTKKEIEIFFIYKEIQNEAVAKSYMRKCFLISEEKRKYLNEEAVSYMTLQLLHSEFLIYEENLIFFFISVTRMTSPSKTTFWRGWRSVGEILKNSF